MTANIYRKIESLDPPVKEAFLALLEYVEIMERTERQLKAISEGLESLARAQAATEERGGRLDIAMEELAQAQARTEKRLEELAQAQTRTEKRLEELAQAQAETERRLQRLIGEHAETRRQLGGLSIAVGYGLEDRAFKALPDLLKRDYGLEVLDRLKRTYFKDNRGEILEVNILGRARRDSQEVLIVGEAKSQLSKRGVDEFLRRKLTRLQGMAPELFPILVTFMTTSPDVEEYARAKGIALYYSFDF